MSDSMKNDKDLTIASLAPLIRRKKLSPVELTSFLLDRIHRLQPAINAYITITADLALARARRAEKEIARGDYRGVLHGIPINFKDLFYTRGVRTTAGSKILADYVPRANAALVQRLLDAGCILLGKTNMHEFAFGVTNANPHYGPVRNPWDTGRISGGSSGGSAASVVSAQAIASFGTDTGGSIRIPSAACGCVGFKPTFELVSLKGVIPLSFTLDHAGPITRCVIDAAYLLDAVANRPIGKDIRKGIQSFRIGLPKQYFFDRIQPGVRKAVLAAAQVFERLGAEIREVNLAGLDQTAAIASEITGAEALAFHQPWLDDRPEDYGENVRSRLEQSRPTTATEYIRSLGSRLDYIQEFDRALQQVHLLLVPTLPIVAPAIGEPEVAAGRSRESTLLALLRLTRPGNLTGLPAISVPCGFSGGLPVGLQLIGRRFDDSSVLRAAYAYEQATTWHEKFPDLEKDLRSEI